MISLDTETTGVDFFHGAQPFFVTICDEDGSQKCWEWDVDSLTRLPKAPQDDLDEIVESLNLPVIMQNSKFDILALGMLRSAFVDAWHWEYTHDTLIAGHLLASNQPHDLTSMAERYLGPKAYQEMIACEEALKKAVKDARAQCKRELPEWKIAKDSDPNIPSAGEETWRFDYWLPRALAKHLDLPEDHEWWTVLSNYSNLDSAITLALWKVMEPKLKSFDVWEIYLAKMQSLPVAVAMEQRGITGSWDRMGKLGSKYHKGAILAGQTCVRIAKEYDYELKLPKGSNNNSLKDFCFGWEGYVCSKCGYESRKREEFECPKCDKIATKLLKQGIVESIGRMELKDRKWLNLRAMGWTESGQPALDKTALEDYELTLDKSSNAYKFVKALAGRRKRSTAVSYMEGYRRYATPNSCPQFFTLHPTLNPTGTVTLQWSSNHPNEQNISKKENFNLRYVFGPAPGREWWSLDASNIELRIPAYESGERDVIEVFEHPERPPYFGSYHLVVFDLLWPDLFAKHGKEVKILYESTKYQDTKNGNFSRQYGAQKKKVDWTFKVDGAFEKIENRFPKITELSNYWVNYADKHGYVETIPDKSIGAKRGYPLMTARTEYGRVKPTLPLCYHVTGTAKWWIAMAMVWCYERLQQWSYEDTRGYYLIAQVHDELVFDFPYSPNLGNLPKIRTIKRLMERGGEGIGIPTPVEVEYHRVSYDKGEKVRV